MWSGTLTLAMALVLAQKSGSPSSAPAGDAVIPICEVVSIERQEVPGADAGVLVEMRAKEGMRVAKDSELGRIDDREAKAQFVVKKLEMDVAKQEAESDIRVRYEKATADVAEKAYEKLKQANEGTKGTVSHIEMLRTLLEWNKAKLGIEKAEEETKSSGLSYKAKEAEVEAAKILVHRRTLRAPFDGVVLKVSKHVGEWVAVGEPVVELVRVDRLSIRGDLVASEWNPADIEGRDVTVEVNLPRGRVEKVPGKVVFVSPVVVGSKLEVWAEIDSPLEKDGRHLVPAGITAQMTIHVNKPSKVEARPVSAPRSAPPTKTTTTGKK